MNSSRWDGGRGHGHHVSGWGLLCGAREHDRVDLGSCDVVGTYPLVEGGAWLDRFHPTLPLLLMVVRGTLRMPEV